MNYDLKPHEFKYINITADIKELLGRASKINYKEIHFSTQMILFAKNSTSLSKLFFQMTVALLFGDRVSSCRTG